MTELHGWLTISETYQNEDLLSQSELDSVMQTVKQIIQESSVSICIQYANGTAFLQTLFCSNHHTVEIDEIIQVYTRIAETATGSYGMIYLRDDEDKIYHNAFQAYVFRKGKRYYQEDSYFSPCIPMTEDEV